MNHYTVYYLDHSKELKATECCASSIVDATTQAEALGHRVLSVQWNPDADTIADLTLIIRRKSTPDALKEYAREKWRTMRARIAGDIEQALRHERNCDIMYADLPTEW